MKDPLRDKFEERVKLEKRLQKSINKRSRKLDHLIMYLRNVSDRLFTVKQYNKDVTPNVNCMRDGIQFHLERVLNDIDLIEQNIQSLEQKNSEVT